MVPVKFKLEPASTCTAVVASMLTRGALIVETVAPVASKSPSILQPPHCPLTALAPSSPPARVRFLTCEWPLIVKRPPALMRVELTDQ